MRTETVSAAKTGHPRPLRQEPHEGTQLRALYDLLMANKGVPIERPLSIGGGGWRLNYLTDFYGLDIRRLQNGRWVLAGEWFGKTYVDYIAPHVTGPSDGAAA